MDRENVTDVRVAGVFPRHPGGVGRRGLELLPDGPRRTEQAVRVAETLRHFPLAVESEHALRRGEERLRLGKGEAAAVREAGVPAARDLAHQLEMLQLVLAHRHERGAI